MADDVATTNVDTLPQTGGDDTLTVTNTDQIQVTDFFDGAGGTDTIVIGAGPAEVVVNLRLGGTDAGTGFHNYEGITFVNTTGGSIVFLNASQFGTGLISSALAVKGTATANQSIDIVDASNFSAEDWSFTDWGPGDGLGIDGTAGADTLIGSSQIDLFRGGLGKDIMTGGLGNDTFSLRNIKESTKGANRDVIMDFNHGEGDGIDLNVIDAKRGVAGNQTFKFIGGKAFHDRPGELQVKYNTNTDIAIVSGDVNGDGKADFQIEVHSDTPLVKFDFFL
jgi:Ca2+-binding RTX toxin-like protein